MICAVYFRMNVGALRFARDLSPLADMEEEKMSRLMARARQDAVSEFGEQRAESEFQRLWKANFQDMTDTINRNYDNIGQLKMMYDRRCELMADS